MSPLQRLVKYKETNRTLLAGVAEVDREMLDNNPTHNLQPGRLWKRHSMDKTFTAFISELGIHSGLYRIIAVLSNVWL